MNLSKRTFTSFRIVTGVLLAFGVLPVQRISAQVLKDFSYTWQFDSIPSPNFYVTSSDPEKSPPNYRGNVNEEPWSLNFDDETFNFDVPKGSRRTYWLASESEDPLTNDSLIITENGLGSGIEIKAKVNAQYGENTSYVNIFKLTSSGDSPKSYLFVLGADRVGFVKDMEGNDFPAPATVSFDATRDFNVYQLYLTYDHAQLFINGELVIDHAKPLTTGESARIEFGVLAKSQAPDSGAGSISYQYIKWGNNMTLGSPTP